MIIPHHHLILLWILEQVGWNGGTSTTCTEDDWRILARKHQGRRPFPISSHRLWNNIKMDVKEVGCILDSGGLR
jgi:aryl-phospho-beta-D-glucosidase BglC (GH1 family)